MNKNRIQSVEKDYQILFNSLSVVPISMGLEEKILIRIDRAARNASLIRLGIYVPLVFASSVAVIMSFQYVAQETAASGLPSYFSVLFSDGGAIASYWQEFLYLIVGQAPVFGITLLLLASLSLLGTLKSAFKNAQNIIHTTHFAH